MWSNDKDANALLKQLNIVAATNMVYNAWKESSGLQVSSRIAFTKQALNTSAWMLILSLRSHLLPQPQMCGTKSRDGWVMCSLMNFVASEPEAATTQPLTDEEIVDLVYVQRMMHKKKNLKMKRRKHHQLN